MRQEIRLSGFGGQGIILSGYILGKAASIFDVKSAVMTQSYGPEARGGACTSNVVIEDKTIAYPDVSHPNVLVLLSQEAYNTYKSNIREGVQVIYDEDLVKLDPGLKADLVPVPAMRLAEELGRKIVANIVVLGFLTAVTGVLAPKAVKQAVLSSVPAHTKELNEKAFDRGYEHGLKVRGKGG